MKFNAPKVGDVRIIRKFTFLPITCKLKCKSVFETRWLCFVEIRQTYIGVSWYNDWFE